MHAHRIWLVIASLVALAMPVEAQAPPSDPKAVEIADQVMAAMGGREAWDGARFIHFTFVRGETVLDITWDKWDGRYRLERSSEGVPYVVLMNVNTREGQAFADGEPLSGAALDEQLEQAYGIWKGETYWFLMPFKMRDPGVVLTYEGEETIDGVTYDKVRLSFEPLGSDDQFWAYVNQSTHLMDRWALSLGGGPRRELWWRDYQWHGPLRLSSIREAMDGTVAITMEDIVVADSMPDAVFNSPDPVARP